MPTNLSESEKEDLMIGAIAFLSRVEKEVSAAAVDRAARTQNTNENVRG